MVVIVLIIMLVVVASLTVKLIIQQAKLSEQMNGMAEEVKAASKAARETSEIVNSWEHKIVESDEPPVD